ncbi:hypothetical protein ALT761_02069 [Alteromonas sp. 76-1]|nr:hypothetical protein ALT761_02069 [Alteromonas sp. 76-1]
MGSLFISRLIARNWVVGLVWMLGQALLLTAKLQFPAQFARQLMVYRA